MSPRPSPGLGQRPAASGRCAGVCPGPAHATGGSRVHTCAHRPSCTHMRGHHTRGLALSQPCSHLCRMTSSEPVFGGTAPGQGWDRHWLLPRAGAEATLTCRRSCLRLPAPPLPQTCPGHAACLGGGGCASTCTGGHPWGWGALPSSLGSAQCPSHPALRPPAGRDPWCAPRPLRWAGP